MRILGFKKEDSAANIAGLSGSYVPGGWYRETDTGKVKYAIDASTLSDELQWGSAAADTVQANLDSYIASNDAALAQEISDREAADVDLQTAIDTKAATSYVNTQLALKVDQSAYDTKIGELEVQDSTHTADIATNASGLAAEITRATAAEGVNATAISDEVTRATAAEGVLDGKIDTEKARIDAILASADADKDSFAEIVALINSVDTENDTAFASYVSSNNAALAQEIGARKTADIALQASIDTKADDSAVVHLAGAETITGAKTFDTDAYFKSSVTVSKGTDVLFMDSSTVSFIQDGVGKSTMSPEFVESNKGQFDQSVSLKDRTTGTEYFLQIDNGEFYISTTELA